MTAAKVRATQVAIANYRCRKHLDFFIIIYFDFGLQGDMMSEKNRPKCSQSHFCQNEYMHNFFREKIGL
jgi:hypothetical protein